MNLTTEIIKQNNLPSNWGIYAIERNKKGQIVLKGAACLQKAKGPFWPMPHVNEHQEVITDKQYRQAMIKGELF